jgi:outer membrane receptor protein involved in Fe transport
VNARYESVKDGIIPTVSDLDFEHTTPKVIANANLGWSDGRWEIDGYLHFQSRSSGIAPLYNGGPSVLVPIARYVSIDGRIGYNFTPWLSLAVSAQNLGHARQHQTSGPDVARQVMGKVTVAF